MLPNSLLTMANWRASERDTIRCSEWKLEIYVYSILYICGRWDFTL